MSVIVQKYGGSSVADSEKIIAVAKRIVETKQRGFDVVVTVSAMGKTTDQLLERAYSVSKEPERRELDMLLSVGERISMSLLAMAIKDLGYQAISFTGSQSGIITDTSHVNAKILEIKPVRILEALSEGKIVIVAGYQGVSVNKEVTTLGRGGTDLTAVALAAALKAEYCEICSDVDGVYSADPRTIKTAKRIDEISFDEMLELSMAGAKVLYSEAVEYAKQAGIQIYASSTFSNTGHTKVTPNTLKRETSVTAVTTDSSLISIQYKNITNNEIEYVFNFLKEEKIKIRYTDISRSESNNYNVFIYFNIANIPDIKRLERAAKRLLVTHSDHHDLLEINNDLNNPEFKCLISKNIGTLTAVADGLLDSPSLISDITLKILSSNITILHIQQSFHAITFFLLKDDLNNAENILHRNFIER